MWHFLQGAGAHCDCCGDIGRTIQCWCDDAAVVIIVYLTQLNREVMHLARCLAFITAKFEFDMVASHIKETDNIFADALSRNQLPLFRSQHPQAATKPSAILEACSTS
jgi:hypothetical protein